MNYLMVILTHKFADRYICDDSIIAASFVEKGSQTGQAISNDGFFFVLQWVMEISINA